MAITQVTPARKVRRRGAALREAGKGGGHAGCRGDADGRARGPDTCSPAGAVKAAFPAARTLGEKSMSAVLGAEP